MKRYLCDCCLLAKQKTKAAFEVEIPAGSMLYQTAADEDTACLCETCYHEHWYYEVSKEV